MDVRFQNPDYLLAEQESAQQLSELFYFGEPHEYFSWRFSLLALAGDQTKDLDRLLSEGISFGGFEVKPKPESDPPAEAAASESTDPVAEEAEARRRYSFAVAEAAALLHHVSETLLRLYFAHCELPVAPWLEIARERRHEKFKKRVRRRFVDAETDAAGYKAIGQVFWGTDDYSKLVPPVDEAAFRAGVENIDKWMRYFARTFLDDSHVYNALKHGLAVNAGDSALKVGEIFDVNGPSLLYLGVREHEERKIWSLTTRWIDLGQAMGAIYVGIRLIETLWQISRLRYAGKKDGPIEIFTGFPFEKFEKARTPSASQAGAVISSMSINLRYYVDPTLSGDPDEA